MGLTAPTYIIQRVRTIDASGKILGRLASEVASFLRGKDKIGFRAHLDEGDKVVIFNTDKLKVSGKKPEQKIYWRHSEYLGSLRGDKYEVLFERDSREVIKKAVFGMLPKNRLRSRIMRKLKLYRGESRK